LIINNMIRSYEKNEISATIKQIENDGLCMIWTDVKTGDPDLVYIWQSRAETSLPLFWHWSLFSESLNTEDRSFVSTYTLTGGRRHE